MRYFSSILRFYQFTDYVVVVWIVVRHSYGKTSLEVTVTFYNHDCRFAVRMAFVLTNFMLHSRTWFLRPIIDIDVINNRLNTVSLIC